MEGDTDEDSAVNWFATSHLRRPWTIGRVFLGAATSRRDNILTNRGGGLRGIVSQRLGHLAQTRNFDGRVAQR
jgi:hypothetical protein